MAFTSRPHWHYVQLSKVNDKNLKVWAEAVTISDRHRFTILLYRVTIFLLLKWSPFLIFTYTLQSKALIDGLNIVQFLWSQPIFKLSLAMFPGMAMFLGRPLSKGVCWKLPFIQPGHPIGSRGWCAAWSQLQVGLPPWKKKKLRVYGQLNCTIYVRYTNIYELQCLSSWIKISRTGLGRFYYKSFR